MRSLKVLAIAVVLLAISGCQSTTWWPADIEPVTTGGHYPLGVPPEDAYPW